MKPYFPISKVNSPGTLLLPWRPNKKRGFPFLSFRTCLYLDSFLDTFGRQEYIGGYVIGEEYLINKQLGFHILSQHHVFNTRKQKPIFAPLPEATVPRHKSNNIFRAAREL